MRQRTIGFSAAIRDMKNARRVELTPEQRKAALDKRAKEAIEAANKRRRYFSKIGG